MPSPSCQKVHHYLVYILDLSNPNIFMRKKQISGFRRTKKVYFNTGRSKSSSAPDDYSTSPIAQRLSDHPV